MNSLEAITESPTARLPSGTPLDLLPPRQRVILLARAARVPMTDLAKLLASRCECGQLPGVTIIFNTNIDPSRLKGGRHKPTSTRRSCG